MQRLYPEITVTTDVEAFLLHQVDVGMRLHIREIRRVRGDAEAA